MRLLGFEVTRTKATLPVNASPVYDSGRWYSVWNNLTTWPTQWFQTDSPPPPIETLLAFHAVFACETLIAADIGKLRYMLIEYDRDGLWTEIESAAFSPVLRRPNRYQNHIQFKEWWITSKLCRGNAYGLKERDARGVVTAVYLLDPCRVTPLVAPNGDVYYQLGEDYLNTLDTGTVVVPASEVIHDRMNCLFHPLVGISPLFACALAADQGLRMQRDGKRFFANNSQPGGVLTAPGEISDPLAQRMKAEWERNYTGENAGRIAVLGDGLKFEPMRMSAVDAQVIEQLKMTAEMVCSVFHVPAHMVGVGPVPPVNNVEALSTQYYSQALQTLIESMEQCLGDGLGLDTPKEGRQLGVSLDLDGLLRMDSATKMQTLKVGVEGGIMAPNEARRRLNLPELTGGDTVYLQQQYFALSDLAKRSQSADPFGKAVPAPATTAAPPDAPDEAQAEAAAKAYKALQRAFEVAEVV